MLLFLKIIFIVFLLSVGILGGFYLHNITGRTPYLYILICGYIIISRCVKIARTN